MTATTTRKFVSSVLIIVASVGPAWAWGPVTQVSIVTTAVHVLSQERSLRLIPLQEYVRDGALVSPEQQAAMFPNYDINPVGAIEREMNLLQAVRGDRVDPYFAFRLGALGSLVSEVTAPMRETNPAYREHYYRDVDAAIQDAQLRPSDRKLVDPQAYFARARAEAQAQSATIEVDYRTGNGFEGMARNSLPIAASRSVDAVADVWYTILSTNVVRPNVLSATMRDYLLSALKFYLDRGNLLGASDTYARTQELNMLTPDVRKEMGDMFYAAGEYERALQEYQAVLVEQPGRRDVMQKVAEYYVRVGTDALENGKLEAARDAFSSALAADQLHPSAQRDLLRAEKMIAERDARLAKAREAIQLAAQAETKAQTEALRRNYAEAITQLRLAADLYGQVGTEFEAEALSADLGMKNIDLLMREYKTDLVSNAQSLSGTGFPQEAKRLAEVVEDLDETALRTSVDRDYRNALQKLRQDLQDSLTRTP